MATGASYQLLIVNTLNNDGGEEFDMFKNSKERGSGSALMDQFEYVMYGKVFEDKISDDNEEL